jgi:hypothetical protein
MIPKDTSRSEKSAQLIRQPALQLVGVPGMSFKTITENHAIYPFAAHAWHHGATQDEDAQRSLIAALVTRWPQTSGQRCNRLDHRYRRLAQSLGGSTVEDVAAGWGIKPDSLERERRDGRETTATVPEETIYPRIVAIRDEVRDEFVLPGPIDPGDVFELGEDIDDPGRLRDARNRFLAALENASQSATVDVLLEDGERVTLQATADTTAAYQQSQRIAQGRGKAIAGWVGDDPDDVPGRNLGIRLALRASRGLER